MSSVAERRRRARTVHATVRISEAVSEAIDLEAAAQVEELAEGLGPHAAERVTVSRSSVMFEALVAGLEVLEARRRARE